jgi:alkanesulfonate monooxygenase SsuD/methylene tetrahydromethanopterin reductase-like flavin-dependent oxidoreductase (luciferase family)
MEFGLALQNHHRGASPAGLTASADAAARHGWRSVWAVDHMVVAANEAEDYGWTLECLLSLAWLGATHPGLRLATGVLVPPMRDAVQLAKELATLDVLTGGRLVVGVGVGDEDDRGEYLNLGKEARFHRRGAYLDETIALWRHLWAGRTDPFVGSFHELRDFTFEPLPGRGGEVLVLSGGRSDRALSRVGRITDGFYSSRWGPDELSARWPAMLAAAAANGRPRPYLATRVRVRLDAPPDGRYSLCGSPSSMVAELGRFAELGTDEFVAVFDAVLPDEIERATNRFQHEVVEPFLAVSGRLASRAGTGSSRSAGH